MKKVSDEETVDLSGRRYNYTDITPGEGGELENSAGYIVFDENTLTMHEEYNSSEGKQADSTYGPYDYGIENGFLKVDVENLDQNKLGMISPDENLIVATDEDSYDEVLFMVRAGGDTTPSTSALSGQYRGTGWDYNYENEPVLETEQAYALYFDGKGNYEYPEVDSGTYSIDDEGRFVRNGETTFGPLTPDGSLFIKPETDPDEAGISIGIKKLSSTETVTNDATQDDTESESIALTSSELEEDFGVEGFNPVGELNRVQVELAENVSTKEEPAMVTFSYEIEGLSGNVEDYQLKKLKGKDDYLDFEYVSETGDFLEGYWQLTKDDAYLRKDEDLDPSETYVVEFKVKDNGDYDLADGYIGKIEDPTVLGTGSESTDDGGTDDGSSDDGGGGGSSGCFIGSLLQ